MKPINPIIEQAETLSSHFYSEEKNYQDGIDKIMAKSWQYVGDREQLLGMPENVFPITLLEKSVNEPLLLLTTAEGEISCMSNVCTHRGFQIVHHPAKMNRIVCGYHGRRFDLDGRVAHMPEFKEVENFPRPCDHLTSVSIERWKRFLFAGIDPQIDFSKLKNRLDERVGFLDIDSWRFAPEYTKTYNINANWALYCDNYLEGFHIPFVHSDLNNIIDYGEYTTACYDHMSVQIGFGKSGDEGFDIPEGHPDYGKVVVAYYYWLFPNFMLNFYPWGVQINIVKPISKDFCKVDFLYFIGDEDKWEKFGKDALAEKVEREDEFVVESVQKGMKSRFYDTGRYSATREKGVHHFHRLISDYLGFDR
jgi:choline monooxygenase